MEKTIWPVIIEYADRFDPDPGHAREVCRLSALLFQALGELHTYEKKERDILKSAALLHDIGWSRPQIAHHKASRDIILADRTIPFSDRERKMVSLIARYHRKTGPKPDHAVFRDLDGADQQIVIFCSGILRIADGLDRAHQNAVFDLTCTIGDDELIISITCRHPSLIDMAVFSEKSQLLETTINRRISLICT